VSARMIAANNRRTDNLVVLGAIEHRFSPSRLAGDFMLST
jgi:hypothetical protein